MEIQKAREIINTDGNNLRLIILNYLITPNNNNNNDIVEAKNALIEKYAKDHLMFDPTRAVVPITSKCKNCNGLGIKISYIQRAKEIPCPACDGTGNFVVKCNRCTHGLQPNGELCKSCKGTGIHSKSSCHICGGNGQLLKLERIKINKVKICEHCGGTGKKEDNKIHNNVLSPENVKALYK